MREVIEEGQHGLAEPKIHVEAEVGSWYGTAHERARCTVKFRSDLTLTHIGEAHPLPERLEQLKRLKFAVE